MRRPFRFIARLVLFLIVESLLLAWLVVALPNVSVGAITTSFLARMLIAAFIIGAINILAPLALITLRIPLNILTVALTLVPLNAILLVGASSFIPNVMVGSPARDALSGALLLSLANTFVTAVFAMDDDYSYFQFALQSRARPFKFLASRQDRTKAAGARGMVLLEIDGLSYPRMQRAIEDNIMPHVREMVSRGSHTLVHFDCGLPSQTSACQAGILYGNNGDIPAFRWFDKRTRKMFVSNHFDDAREINNAASTGHGLLRDGTSINNLLNGDASRSLLTLCVLNGDAKVPTERATDELNAFWLNPYTFGRTLALCVGDLFVEIFQALWQDVTNRKPRVNRLRSGYPFLRILTNIFLRNLSAYAVMREIIRGSPIIYTTFVGYDEVAHHAGPDTPDAMHTLRGFDKHVRHIQQTIERLAPNPYDVFLLSDHGQSVGATFLQRYGKTLREWIDSLTGEITVGEMKPTEAGQSYARALVSELSMMSEQLTERANTRIRRATMKTTVRALDRVERMSPKESPMQVEGIVVCASGNLAHVYFCALGEDKIPFAQIEAAHPQLITTLVQHEGIGFVVGYDESGDIIVFGKAGAKNLSTGIVSGEDPLRNFGDAELRGEQVLRLAQFDNAGDLILNSALFGDGSVTAFEELVGSHGGLGGQQTDAFILHPSANRAKFSITNSEEVFRLLNDWRKVTSDISHSPSHIRG